MNWKAFGFIFVLTSVALSQSPTVQIPKPLADVFDALYAEFDLDLPEGAHEKGVTDSVDRLFSSLSGAVLDDAAAALLQFELPEPIKTRIIGHCRARGASAVPYLKKYRDRPYVLPRNYEYSMRLSPSWRRTAYDEVLSELTHSDMRLGLKPGVLSFVRPVLDAWESKQPEVRNGLWDAFQKILDAHTPDADEALVVLLDYVSDAGYDQGLTGEIVERGERMLKWLRKYQHEPTYALATQYEITLQAPSIRRSDRFEWFIEVIQLHEKFHH